MVNNGMNDTEREENNQNNSDIDEFALDFNTSSAITKIHIKILIFYIPIFWMGGLLTLSAWDGLNFYLPFWLFLSIFPFILFALYYVFIFGCIFTTKLFLILINLIHKPKQGIFKAEEGDKDFEFWRLRIELKKVGIWLLNNNPLPWADSWAFRWFGVKMDFTSHGIDAWIDVEFLRFGRKVTIGQGAVVMSSMIVGKYLIIKESVFDDYAVIGGVSTIAPGTIIGKDTVLGALSSTNFNQLLESGWIYFGIPGIKLKPNKFAETKRDIITKRDVDARMSYEVFHDFNIDEDKRNLINNTSRE